MPYAIFRDFYIDEVSNCTVHAHFDLVDSWAYIKFPVEEINMDDDAVLGKFRVKDVADPPYGLTYVVEVK